MERIGDGVCLIRGRREGRDWIEDHPFSVKERRRGSVNDSVHTHTLAHLHTTKIPSFPLFSHFSIDREKEKEILFFLIVLFSPSFFFFNLSFPPPLLSSPSFC